MLALTIDMNNKPQGNFCIANSHCCQICCVLTLVSDKNGAKKKNNTRKKKVGLVVKMKTDATLIVVKGRLPNCSPSQLLYIPATFQYVQLICDNLALLLLLFFHSTHYFATVQYFRKLTASVGRICVRYLAQVSKSFEDNVDTTKVSESTEFRMKVFRKSIANSHKLYFQQITIFVYKFFLLLLIN